MARIAATSVDPEAPVRAQMLLWSSALLLALALGWGTGHLAYGGVGIPLFAAGCAVGTAVVWIKLWYDQKLAFASHVVVALLVLAAVVGAFYTGGLRATNVAPLMMVIVVSIMLIGRWGLLWCAVSLSAALALQVGHWIGFDFPHLVPVDQRSIDAAFTWMSSAVVVLLFVAANDRSRGRIVADLAAANRVKGEFLADVSHDLRNPLHAVLASAQELAGTRLSASQRQLVADIQQCSVGLFTFLGDLVDLAAAQSGRFTLELKAFSIAEELRQVRAIARVLCRAKQLTFTYEGSEGAGDHVRGDGRRLRQILTNVLSNAVRYTTSGSVALSALAELRGDEVVWRFTVTDTGVGVRPDDLTSSHADVSGSGRGLAIVRQLTSSMGGSVEITGSASGSRALIEVPFAAAEPEGAVSLATEAPSRRLRVLVVDDVEINRRLLQRMLQRLGQEVSQAIDGEDAVAQFARGQPDLVLMDLRMPGWDGVETVGRLRQIERARGWPATFVVIATGDACDAIPSKMTAAGADECLFKPFHMQQIRDLVRRCVDRLDAVRQRQR